MSTVPFSRRPNVLPPEDRKKLPFNTDAERAVLGAVLLDESVPNATFEVVHASLKADDFFLPPNRTIFLRMLEMSQAGVLINTLTLVDQLEITGHLETAGGAGYVASLIDGVARSSNVAHYSKIIKEKARLRSIIQLAHDLKEEAFSGTALPDELTTRIQWLGQQHTAEENPAVVVGFRRLLDMEMAPLEFAIEPLLTTGGTGEIYAWRGTGKSWFATELAVQLATGAPVLFPVPKGGGHWPISRAYRVLYVYGEMHGSMIQDRARQIAIGHDRKLPTDEFLGTMCKDFQKSWRPNIATPRNRRFIEERLFGGSYEGLILDNISTLWPESQEGEGDRSATLSNWFMDLNQRGVWVIFLHHAGKSGVQRGSSEKEDMLDFAMRLRRPDNKKKEPRLCAQIDLEKIRGECKDARWSWPFEITLDTAENKGAVWLMRPTRDAQLESAFAMYADGAKPGDVVADLGISRATAYRYRKLFEENPEPRTWLEKAEQADD